MAESPATHTSQHTKTPKPLCLALFFAFPVGFLLRCPVYSYVCCSNPGYSGVPSLLPQMSSPASLNSISDPDRPPPVLTGQAGFGLRIGLDSSGSSVTNGKLYDWYAETTVEVLWPCPVRNVRKCATALRGTDWVMNAPRALSPDND